MEKSERVPKKKWEPEGVGVRRVVAGSCEWGNGEMGKWLKLGRFRKHNSLHNPDAGSLPERDGEQVRLGGAEREAEAKMDIREVEQVQLKLREDY